jgi:small GTP-binding protein
MAIPAGDLGCMMQRNVFKVIIVGEAGVGKTSLVKRYVDDAFDEQMKMTIGVDISVKRLSDGAGMIALQIWDLGGQPQFKDVADLYFRGAKGTLAVFDVTRKASMIRLTDWIESVRSKVGEVPMIVLGNKTDLRTSEVTGIVEKEGIEFASKYKSEYVETSAKDGNGVEESFSRLVDKLKLINTQT